MPRPTQTPIGIVLSRTTKAVERAFDETLAANGSSRPVWLVLLALRAAQPSAQNGLAAEIGIREATLTHHLAAMETDGLVVRERDPANRRVQQVRMTDEGEATFARLIGVVRAHDRRLRAGLDETEVEALRGTLGRLLANVTP